MSELNPCPFCGGKVIIESKSRNADDHGFRWEHLTIFTCKNCGGKTSFDESKDSAISKWNKRNN